MDTTTAPQRVTIKVEIELEIDPTAYHASYGVEVPQLASDVQSYAAELFNGANACLEGCWDVTRVDARRGRPRRTPGLAR